MGNNELVNVNTFQLLVPSSSLIAAEVFAASQVSRCQIVTAPLLCDGTSRNLRHPREFNQLGKY